jgi:hypothetical protein
LDGVDLAAWQRAVASLPAGPDGARKRVDVQLRTFPACAHGRRLPPPWRLRAQSHPAAVTLWPPLLPRPLALPGGDEAAAGGAPLGNLGLASAPRPSLASSADPAPAPAVSLLVLGPVVGRTTESSAVLLLESAVDAFAVFTLRPCPEDALKDFAVPLGAAQGSEEEGEEEGEEEEVEESDEEEDEVGEGAEGAGSAAGEASGEDGDGSGAESEASAGSDAGGGRAARRAQQRAQGAVLTFGLRLRGGVPGAVECTGLQPSTTYKVDLVLSALQPASRGGLGVGTSGGGGHGGGGGGGAQDSLRHCATVRTPGCFGGAGAALGATLAITHDGLGCAALDPRAPSPLEWMSRHAAPQCGAPFSASAERAADARARGARAPPWSLCVHLGGQVDGRRAFSAAGAVLRSADREAAALPASRRRAAQKRALAAAAAQRARELYQAAYRRAWGHRPGVGGYDAGGRSGAGRLLAHGGGHLMLPSPLDVGCGERFSDEALLTGADARAAAIGWEVARLYQGQTWAPLPRGPAWGNPWADPSSEPSESSDGDGAQSEDIDGGGSDDGGGGSDDDDEKGAAAARARAPRVTAPPGCCVQQWGGGASGGGGFLVAAVSSRVLLDARGHDRAAADLLGAWLARQLFDVATPPLPTRADAAAAQHGGRISSSSSSSSSSGMGADGLAAAGSDGDEAGAASTTKLGGATALVLCLDLPLVAAEQSRPSPTLDDAGRRRPQADSWAALAPRCFQAIFLCVCHWRRLHPRRSAFVVCGGFGAAASAVWTMVLPQPAAADWPPGWLRLLREPVLCAFRPPPLASQTFLLPGQPPPAPPAPPPAKPANANAADRANAAAKAQRAAARLARKAERAHRQAALAAAGDTGGGVGASAAGAGGAAFVAALLPSDLLRQGGSEECVRPGGGLRHAFLLAELGSGTLAPNDDCAGGAGQGGEGREPPSLLDLAGAADTGETSGEAALRSAVNVRWLHLTRDANVVGSGLPGGRARQLDERGSEFGWSSRLFALAALTKRGPGATVGAATVQRLLYRGQEEEGGALSKKAANAAAVIFAAQPRGPEDGPPPTAAARGDEDEDGSGGEGRDGSGGEGADESDDGSDDDDDDDDGPRVRPLDRPSGLCPRGGRGRAPTAAATACCSQRRLGLGGGGSWPGAPRAYGAAGAAGGAGGGAGGSARALGPRRRRRRRRPRRKRRGAAVGGVACAGGGRGGVATRRRLGRRAAAARRARAGLRRESECPVARRRRRQPS